MVALPTLLAFVGRKITNRTNGMLWEVAKHADKTEKDLPRRDIVKEWMQILKKRIKDTKVKDQKRKKRRRKNIIGKKW